MDPATSKRIKSIGNSLLKKREFISRAVIKPGLICNEVEPKQKFFD